MKAESGMSLIKERKRVSSTPMFVIAIIAIIQVFCEALDAVPILTQVISLLKLPVLLVFWLIGYLFLFSSGIRIKQWMYLGMLWIVLMTSFSLLGDEYSFKRLIMDGSILFLAIIFDFFYQRGEADRLYALAILALVCMAVTILYTCVMLKKYPTLSKVMTTGSYARMQSQLGTIVYGAGGYDFVYGSLSLFPVLIMMLKSKSRRKFLILFFLILSGAFILMAQYTIAILLLFVSIVVSLMIRKKIRISLVMLFIIVAVLLYVSGAVEVFLRWLITLYPSSSMVGYRLKILLNIITEQNLNSFYRAGTYTWNLNSFAERPYGNVFINCFTSQPIVFNDPNHLIYPPDSEWLYLFSYYGIFIAPVFIAFLTAFLHDIFMDRKRMNSKVFSGVVISYCLLFVIGILNTLFRSTVLGGIMFLVIPSILVSSRKTTAEDLPVSQEDMNEDSMDLQHYAPDNL